MLSPLSLFTAQIVAIISVLLSATGYLKADLRSSSSRVFAVLSIFVVFYILNGMTASHIDPNFQIDLSNWQLVVDIGVSAISGLFMIYCFLIFQEGESFPRTLGVALLIQVLLDSWLSLSNLSQASFVSTDFSGLMVVTMDVLQLGFVCLAIYWTLKGWSADLVEDRRILRWFIISIQGSLIFAVLFLENFLLDGGSEGNATVQAVIVVAIALLTLGMLLVALKFDFISLSHAIRKVTKLDESIEGGLASFNPEGFDAVFKAGYLYREAGLTISVLAKKLSLPEYRLRAFIHKELGYRNFNAMLHQYRIEDAANSLSETKNQNLPVLTIALSVGYQSITPFNNAFRQLKGMTPSEYRRKNRIA